jgi:hypothetical protein
MVRKKATICPIPAYFSDVSTQMIPSKAKTEIMDGLQQIKILMKGVTYEHVMKKTYKLYTSIRRQCKQEYINLCYAESGVPTAIKAPFDEQL